MKMKKVSFKKLHYQGSSKKVIHITKGSGILGEEFQYTVITKMMDRLRTIARKRFLKRIDGSAEIKTFVDQYDNCETVVLMFESQVQATFIATRTDLNNFRYDFFDCCRGWWDYPHIVEMVNARRKNFKAKSVNYKKLRKK